MQAEVLAGDDPAAIVRAAALLGAGELVAFPTETVYGIGVRADRGDAVRRLFAAKGRPEEKALIVHVPDVDAGRRIAASWDERASRLAAAFWPGPLTLVLPRSAEDELADEVAAGGTTIALRAPAHPVAQALLGACAFPVAAPSANLSGEPPARDAGEVLRKLGARIALVLDGGRSSEGAPSTIVDLTRAPARILRQGALARERIAALVPLSEE